MQEDRRYYIWQAEGILNRSILDMSAMALHVRVYDR